MHMAPRGSTVRITRLAALGLAAGLLAGCAAPARIDASRLPAAKTVAIQDIPRMRVAALIGGPFLADPAAHFSAKVDYFFVGSPGLVPGVPGYYQQANDQALQQIANSPRPMTPAAAGLAAGVAGAVGALIQSSAEETQKRAMGFEAELLKRFPSYDLRAEFLAGLQASLRAKGMEVRVIADLASPAPRLRWPAVDASGKPSAAPALKGSPMVDADILMQVSPVAFYLAPGPLNPYHRAVGVGVALYEGRTGRFLGNELIRFRPNDSRFEYMKYDELLGDLGNAAPALRTALLSLVPHVANTVGGTPAPAVTATAGPMPRMPLPADNDGPVPFLDAGGQARFREFLARPLPRAFAIAPTGHSFSAWGRTPARAGDPVDVSARALLRCREAAGQECLLYMVDDRKIYRPQ